MAQHIFVGTTPPATTPTDVGQHWIDTAAKKSYISVGTSSSSDWIPTGIDIDILSTLTTRPAADDELAIFSSDDRKISLSDFISKRGTISDRAFFWSTDFIISETNILSSSGAGAGNSTQQGTYGMNNIERAIGISETDTGTTATGRRTISSSLSSLTTGLGRLRFGARHALNQLSDGTNPFTSTLGFINVAGAGDHNAGAYFSYTHNVNGGRWEAVTASGSGTPTRTRVDTGVAADNLYNIFEVEIVEDTSQALFYINGALVATITTNLPPTSTAANFTFGYGWKIEKGGAGTTAVAHSTDWAYFELERSTAR